MFMVCGCFLGVCKVIGNYLDVVCLVSSRCLFAVWRVFVGCLNGVLGVSMVSMGCPNDMLGV